MEPKIEKKKSVEGFPSYVFIYSLTKYLAAQYSEMNEDPLLNSLCWEEYDPFRSRFS